MKAKTMSFCPLKRKLCGEADYTGAAKDGICAKDENRQSLEDIKICPKEVEA